MRKQISHFMAFTFLLLLSCGKKPQTNYASADKSTGAITESEDVLRFIQDSRKIRVQCLEVDCPQGLFFVSARRYTTGENTHCSGLMIGLNQLAIPSSCLPNRMLKEGKDCSNSVLAKDYKTDELYVCDKVVSAKVDKGSVNFPQTWKDDLVVLQFKKLPSDQNFGIPYRGGIYQKKLYGFWRYQFDPVSERAFLKVDSCFVGFKNYIQPLGTSPYSPSLSLVACGMEEPLGESDLGGVVFKEVSFGNYKALGMVNSVLTDYGSLRIHEGFKGAALIQNFACFDYYLRSNGKKPHKNCAESLHYDLFSKGRYSQLKLKLSSREFEESRQLVEENFNENRDKFIKWKVSYVPANTEAIFIPEMTCFKNVNVWLKKFRDSGVFGGRYDKRHSYDVQWSNPVLSPILRVDGLIEHSLGGKEERTFKLTFSPRSLFKKGRSEVWGSPAGGVTLPVCR